MEYFIGQEIELIHNGENIKLKIEEDKTRNCEKCFFKVNNKSNCTRHDYNNMNDAFCTSMFRIDKKYIIYKQIK